MNSYLVTGGAGFIGSNIVEALVNKGEKVRVLDNFSTGRRKNIEHLLDKIELVEGDLRDYGLIMQVTSGVDYVIHQAALPSVFRSIQEPVIVNEVNVNGTLHILNSAVKNKVKRVVYASSSSVYGDTPVLPKKEEFIPSPLSPYAITKLTGEYYCRVFHGVYGLETVSLRYFNVFGPRQDPTSEYSAVIPKFISIMMGGKAPTVYGDGKQTRDFTYIDNVVSANLKACTAADAAGSFVNIACGERISLLQLIEHLNKALETNIEPLLTESRKGDVKHSLADISQAEKFIGYTPLVSTQEGLLKTVKWFSSHLER
ncbi:MAG: SDR family oxidoreductase [bacterium]